MIAPGRPPLFAVVLFGGGSRRMGRPKHLIAWRGESWIERIVAEAARVTDDLFLAGEGELPSSLASRRRLADAPGVSGPLGGLLAALRERPDAAWLALACDQPLLTAAALRWLLDERVPGSAATLPRLGPERIEPFPGIYEASCRPALESLALEPGARRSLQRLPELARVAQPPVPAALRGQFRGANSPEELAEITRSSPSSPPARPREG